jgi:hypothetical protein
VVRKAVRRSTRKRARARPRRRRTLPPDLGPVAENLPRDETSENLPPILVLDRPSSWSREETQAREEELSQRKNIDRALAGVKVKPAAQTELTEEQIQELMGDVSTLSALEKKLRRYTVIKHREQWRDHDPGRVRTATENDPLYAQEVGVARHHVSTWRRALDRKAKNN